MKGRKPRLLVVEGYSDKRFLLGLLRHSGLDGRVDVVFPGELSSNKGKSGALKQFALWLEEAAEPGRYESISVCVDADCPPQEGFASTEAELQRLLAGTQFRLADAGRRRYVHVRSGCQASYWICPDQQSDGYLETLAIASLANAEKTYLDTAVLPYLRSLNVARFDAYNFDRASLYAYLAVQRKPDKSLPTLMDDRMLDLESGAILHLRNWLADISGG